MFVSAEDSRSTSRQPSRCAAGRLEQSYARLPDEGGSQRYRYAAPAFGFTSTLIYDESGLVLDYPGIAVRAR